MTERRFNTMKRANIIVDFIKIVHGHKNTEEHKKLIRCYSTVGCYTMQHFKEKLQTLEMLEAGGINVDKVPIN